MSRRERARVRWPRTTPVFEVLMYMGVDHADVGTLVVGMGPCPICREWHCLSCYSENDLGRHCDYDGWHFTVDALKPLTRAAREMLELVK